MSSFNAFAILTFFCNMKELWDGEAGTKEIAD